MEVILISSCNDEQSFTDYHALMPWPAVMWKDRDACFYVRKALRDNGRSQNSLPDRCNIQSLPSLVLLDPRTGEILKQSVRDDLLEADKGKSIKDIIAEWPSSSPIENKSLLPLIPSPVIICAGAVLIGLAVKLALRRSLL